jgi:hypothetical protein
MKDIINQLFEIESKIKSEELPLFKRNFQRIYHELEQEGYTVINPIGKIYDERDVAIEANILSETGRELRITKVLKPIIYKVADEKRSLFQKAIVIVE